MSGSSFPADALTVGSSIPVGDGCEIVEPSSPLRGGVSVLHDDNMLTNKKINAKISRILRFIMIIPFKNSLPIPAYGGDRCGFVAK